MHSTNPHLEEDRRICLGYDEEPSDRHGGMMPPINQTSLFSRRSFGELLAGLEREHENFVYSRGQNPTVAVLERKLAALERAEACKCFASGMAAISATISALLEAGDHIVFANQIYGPTLELAQQLRRSGIEHDIVLTGDVDDIRRVLRGTTRLIYIESPGTMLFRLLDVEAIASLAGSRKILTLLDNSWATPLFQKPITMGVDLVVHSLSKYVGGHSDVIAGAVAGRAELLEEIFYRGFLLQGGVLAPFDAWLLIRSLRTLHVRMLHHQEAGLAVARDLVGQPKIRRVFHPAVSATETDPLARRLFGYSGLFSVELDTDRFDDVCRFIDTLELFRVGVSWGGAESLVISPNRGNNAESLRSQQIPASLVRLSVGLDDPEALTQDVRRALSVL